MKSGIYEIINIKNGHRYIGSAMDIERRWRHHKKALYDNKHHSVYLQNAWNKYGKDCFIFNVIENCFFFILIQREQHYIDELNPEYNILKNAGSRLGTKHKPESISKMSFAHKKYRATEETKTKMSIKRKGVNHTEEHKKNIGIALKGRFFSEETRKKISEAMKGKKASEETRKKLSEKRIGKTPSIETRKKLSEWQIGKKLSEEHKNKLSMAKKEFYAKKRKNENDD